MTASFAIDTNIAIYALSEHPKCHVALALLEAGPHISVQLLNEFANASLRKRRLPWPEIEELLGVINSLARDVRPMDLELHRLGRAVAKRYKLGLYDSLMLAAALQDKCVTFYSEDMQHGLLIAGQLTVTNPFMETA